MQNVIPEVYKYIEMINNHLINELVSKGLNISMKNTDVSDLEPFVQKDKHSKIQFDNMKIIDDGVVHMARLAAYVSSHINGVAWIHSEILKMMF